MTFCKAVHPQIESILYVAAEIYAQNAHRQLQANSSAGTAKEMGLLVADYAKQVSSVVSKVLQE